MRFVVYDPVLNADDAVLSLIDRLVDRLAEKVHNVEIHDLDLLQESSWFQKARITRKSVLMSAAAKPPRAAKDRRGPHTKVLDVLDAESAKLADRLAHTPLVILVEDRESDGILLDILVEELGWPELQTLWEHGRKATPRAAEITTAGGKNAIPQRVARVVKDAAEENRPLRLFVLCDSDARWPGDGPKAFPIIEACTQHGVPYHIWRKRCAENYIPDEVFEAMLEDPRFLGHIDRFQALLRRSRLQRDHFPFKDGLKSEERSGAIRAGLYDSSEEEELRLLERRLFKKSPRPLLQLNSERRGSFTATGLRARDGDAELETLLQAIAQEL